MKREIDSLKKSYRDKEVEAEKNSSLLKIFDSRMKDVQQIVDSHVCQKKIYKEAMTKYLQMLEEKTRKEKRLWLNEQAFRLGRLTT